MASIFKTIQPGSAPMNTDIDHIRMALSGTADVGVINLASVQTAPSAPTLALVAGTGSVNNAVKYQLVAITGWLDTYYNMYVSGLVAGAEASITASNQTVNVTIPSFAAPIIGYAIYRTPGAGATGTEKYVGIFTNPAGGTFNDNVPDGTIGTGMITSLSTVSIPAAVPTTNTTGTSITVGNYITPWIAPTLLNSYTNVGSGASTAGYFKDVFGIVHLKGCVKGGTQGQTIFTLPVGYRPIETSRYPAIGNEAYASVYIATGTGNVVAGTNSNVATYFQMDGITFPTW